MGGAPVGASTGAPASESQNDVQSPHPQEVALAEVERLGVVRMVVPNFGAKLERVAQLMCPAERVARVVCREACPLALLVAPPLVAEREEIATRDLVHRVVQNAVRLAQARDVGADAAAAAERSYRAQAWCATEDGIALPHEIRLGLRMPVGVELVLPGADQIVEVVVPGGDAAGLAAHLEALKLRVVDRVQDQVDRIVVRLRYPAH